MADNHKILCAPDYEGAEVWRPECQGPIPVGDYHEETFQKLSTQSSCLDLKIEGAQSVPDKPRKKRPWLLAVAGLVAFIIGLGVGGGIGYAIDKPNSESSSSPTPTIATASPTSSPVMSGSTGIADFSCNSSAPYNKYTTKVNPMTFTQDRFQDYPDGLATFDNAGRRVNSLDKHTVYTFQACMKQCALYNGYRTASQQNCKALSYNANLTWYVPLLGGNCFLEDARGAAWRIATGWPVDVMASAYISDRSQD